MIEGEPLVSVVSAVVVGPALTTLSVPETGPAVTSAQVPGPGLTLTSASQPGPGLSVLSGQVSGPPGRPGADGAGAWRVGVPPLEQPDGERIAFTAPEPYQPGTLAVTWCGFGLTRGAHFTESGGPAQLEMSEAPRATDHFFLTYQIATED